VQSTRPGRGFWTVTALLGVIAVAGVIYFWKMPSVQPWLPPEGGRPGNEVDSLFRFMAASAAVLYTYVVGYIVYFVIAYRRRKSDPPDALGVNVHDNNKLEAAWTIVPTLFVILLSALSVRIWSVLYLEQPTNGLVVESIAHQWGYAFRYPNVNGEISSEMHLPVNVPVTLNLASQDVIHSFWVPDMRLKADMIPGMINTIHFTPTRVGRYPIICTEFCGTLHSRMNGQISAQNGGIMVVEPAAAYQRWYSKTQIAQAHAPSVAAAPSGAINLANGNAGAGKTLFSQRCAACHALGPFSQRVVGPGLLGVLHDPAHPNLVDGDPATPADVAKILENGFTGSYGHMPNQSENGISNQDIANLVAYLNTLK
jgi:cytochrome c oxidase subunit 2